jgi:hypothetical protein
MYALLREDTLSVLPLEGVRLSEGARIEGSVTRYTLADRTALTGARISTPGGWSLEAVVTPRPPIPGARRGPARLAQVRDWLAGAARDTAIVRVLQTGDQPIGDLVIERVAERRQGDSTVFGISLVAVRFARLSTVAIAELAPALRADVASGRAETQQAGTRPPRAKSVLAAGADSGLGALRSLAGLP